MQQKITDYEYNSHNNVTKESNYVCSPDKKLVGEKEWTYYDDGTTQKTYCDNVVVDDKRYPVTIATYNEQGRPEMISHAELNDSSIAVKEILLSKTTGEKVDITKITNVEEMRFFYNKHLDVINDLGEQYMNEVYLTLMDKLPVDMIPTATNINDAINAIEFSEIHVIKNLNETNLVFVISSKELMSKMPFNMDIIRHYVGLTENWYETKDFDTEFINKFDGFIDIYNVSIKMTFSNDGVLNSVLRTVADANSDNFIDSKYNYQYGYESRMEHLYNEFGSILIQRNPDNTDLILKKDVSYESKQRIDSETPLSVRKENIRRNYVFWGDTIKFKEKEEYVETTNYISSNESIFHSITKIKGKVNSESTYKFVDGNKVSGVYKNDSGIYTETTETKDDGSVVTIHSLKPKKKTQPKMGKTSKSNLYGKICKRIIYPEQGSTKTEETIYYKNSGGFVTIVDTTTSTDGKVVQQVITEKSRSECPELFSDEFDD